MAIWDNHMSRRRLRKAYICKWQGCKRSATPLTSEWNSQPQSHADPRELLFLRTTTHTDLTSTYTSLLRWQYVSLVQ